MNSTSASLKSKALFIDDDEASIVMLSRALSQSNYEVVHRKTVADGLSYLAANAVLITFLDIVMSHIDGVTACRDVVVANQPHQGLVAIHSSLSLDDLTMIEIYEAGAIEIFRKPVALETTLAKINAWQQAFPRGQA